jgi:NADPH-dependent 2,4-dienoyl-CoA reductase/sulfur reductase-like enzyme
MIQKDVEVAVIGGGAAGLAAAVEARREGVQNVLILERGEDLGGVLPQCIHTGFGLHYFGENLSGPEYISRFIKMANEYEVGCKLNTMILKVSPNRRILAINSIDGLLRFRAKAIVLAMGCRERPRGALGLPGTRPAGIFTAGTAQRLMDVEGYMPGKRVVILGSGDVGLIMARRLTMEGATVKAVIEVLPYPGGLSRNVVQCLEDFGTPLLLNHTVTNIHGIDRLEGVSIARVDEHRRPIPVTEERLACDTLILSVGLIPENELSKEAGILLDEKTGGPVVDECMETSIKGVFACGNVVHVNDLVDHVTWSGENAGSNAARHALDIKLKHKRRIHVRAGANVRYVVPHIISGEKPVTLFLRVKKPLRRVTINVGDELAFYRRIVKPPEILVLKLPGDRRIRKEQITVSVERRDSSEEEL